MIYFSASRSISAKRCRRETTEMVGLRGPVGILSATGTGPVRFGAVQGSPCDPPFEARHCIPSGCCDAKSHYIERHSKGAVHSALQKDEHWKRPWSVGCRSRGAKARNRGADPAGGRVRESSRTREGLYGSGSREECSSR